MTITKPHPETEKEETMVEDFADQVEYRHAHQTWDMICTHESWGMKGLGKSVPFQEMTLLKGKEGRYGQDRAFIRTISGTLSDLPFQATVGVIADGHGIMGEEASEQTVQNIKHVVFPRLAGWLDKIMNKQSVDEDMRVLYQELDEYYTLEVGGSTLTLWVLYFFKGRVFLLSTNVGDSPLMLVNNKNGRVLTLATMHNWDCVKERRAHIKACQKAGYPIPKIIFNRWNCSNGIKIPDVEGIFKVIPIFKIGSHEVEEVNRDHVMKILEKRKMVGGTQSLRQMKELVWSEEEQDFVEKGMSKYGHENCGSTPLEVEIVVRKNIRIAEIRGGPQMSRTVGDKRYKKPAHAGIPYMTADPSVSLLEFYFEQEEPIDLTVLGVSDGYGDIFYHHQWGEMCSNFFQTHPKGMGQELASYLHSLTLAKGWKNYPPTRGEQAWDDLSLICHHIIFKSSRG